MGPTNRGNWTVSERSILKNPGTCFFRKKKPLRERCWALKACKLQQNQAQLTKRCVSKIRGHFPAHIRPFGAFSAANLMEFRAGADERGPVRTN